ncbi:hypothetical protein [Campylobacter sp.]|nr:hypothetical protein [Campylobacter sp.]
MLVARLMNFCFICARARSLPAHLPTLKRKKTMFLSLAEKG